jgi:hypothetical protein
MLKPTQLRLVGRQTLGKKLKRHFAPESLVSRQIDFAHSADADERLDAVVTD